MTRFFAGLIICACLIAVGYFLGNIFQLPDETAGPGRSGAPGGAPAGGNGGYPPSAGVDEPVPVVAAPALHASIRERISASGVLEPEREVTIIARVEGVIEGIEVEEGEPVDESAVLCRIDESALRIAADQARVDHEYATAEFDRIAELRKQSEAVVTTKEVEDLRVAMERAAAAHARAQLDLTHARPRAPFAGTIVRRSVDKGQYVRVGDELFTLADFEPLLLRIHLPESDVTRVAVGQPVELRADRTGETVATGSVLRVSPVVDRASLTVEVTTSFAAVPATLRPGAFGRVDVITRTHDDVVLVPRSAVIRRKEGPAHLFRVLPGDGVQRLEVETGYEDETVVQIRGDVLEPGDLVVVEGNRELDDGSRVQIYRQVPVRGNPLSVLPRQE